MQLKAAAKSAATTPLLSLLPGPYAGAPAAILQPEFNDHHAMENCRQ